MVFQPSATYQAGDACCHTAQASQSSGDLRKHLGGQHCPAAPQQRSFVTPFPWGGRDKQPGPDRQPIRTKRRNNPTDSLGQEKFRRELKDWDHTQHLGDVEQREHEDSCNSSLSDICSPAIHWHLQTCFCTQLSNFSCYLHFGTLPDRSGHSSLSCLPFKGRDSTPKFAMGFMLAGKRMLLKSELRNPLLPAQPGSAVFLTSCKGQLWPRLPRQLQRQGQAEITPPRPGCHHHAGSSAQIACVFILHHHCRRSRKGTRQQKDLSVEESHANLETAATSLLGLL